MAPNVASATQPAMLPRRAQMGAGVVMENYGMVVRRRKKIAHVASLNAAGGMEHTCT